MTLVVQTPRLLLREMTRDDLGFLAELLGDPEVTRFYPQLFTFADAEAWLERQLGRYARDGHGGWLAVDRSSGEPVGQVGLSNQLVEGVWEPEIGYMIRRSRWREGLATEAALAVRDHAFLALGKRYVISLVRPINQPSRAVARRMGMQPCKLTLHAGLEHLVYRVEQPPARGPSPVPSAAH